MTTHHSIERSALTVTSMMAFLGPFMMSAVNVALPAIQKNFAMNAVEMSWVATGYLLTMAAGLVPAGKIADIYGRKKVFICGVALFTLSSALSAYAPTTQWLITWRLAQGLGSAMYNTTGMAILTSVFPPQRRGQILGVYVAAVYIGLSVGPFFGGLLVQHLGWASIFLAMVPLGLAAMAVTFIFLKGEWAEARGERLDVVGSIIYVVAIIALVYGITRLPDLISYGIIIAGVAALVVFVRLQQWISYPVFDVSLFKTNHAFAFSSLAALINYSATTAIAFLLSLYLQYIKGLEPQMAGIVLISQPVIQAILSPLAGRLADRTEPRLIASAGMAVTVIGLAVFTQMDAGFPMWAIVANLILLGFGFSLFSSPNISAIMGAVEKRHYGIASGVSATMRLLGQMLSMAIATVMISIYVGQTAINPDNFAQFLKSMTMAFTIFTVLCIFGVYFSMFRGKYRTA
jgi:EmrB/QacA subfamily drug resistance transporter